MWSEKWSRSSSWRNSCGCRSSSESSNGVASDGGDMASVVESWDEDQVGLSREGEEALTTLRGTGNAGIQGIRNARCIRIAHQRLM